MGYTVSSENDAPVEGDNISRYYAALTAAWEEKNKANGWNLTPRQIHENVLKVLDRGPDAKDPMWIRQAFTIPTKKLSEVEVDPNTSLVRPGAGGKPETYSPYTQQAADRLNGKAGNFQTVVPRHYENFAEAPQGHLQEQLGPLVKPALSLEQRGGPAPVAQGAPMTLDLAPQAASGPAIPDGIPPWARQSMETEQRLMKAGLDRATIDKVLANLPNGR